LVDESKLSVFEHPEQKFCPKQSKHKGLYVVLINGTSDAEFYISTAKWSSVMIPRVPGPNQANVSTTMAVDGEMVIVEPKGVNFFNLLNNVTKTLRIDPAAMVYVLKTIFVGITDEGITDVITTIRPLQFILTDITATFDASGAQYTISFVGAVNGGSKMPYVNAIANGFSADIASGSSLGAAMEIVTKKLNELYLQERKKLIESANACGGDKKIDFENEFMPVRYAIEIDPAYKDYKTGTSDSIRQQAKGDGDSVITEIGENGTIEGIINSIMQSSLQVLKDAELPVTDNIATTQRKIYKIASDVRIDRNDRGEREYLVTFYVHQYKGTFIPHDKVEDFSPNPPGIDENDPQSRGIVFDYIFSGKNIDIIDFDLNMQYGLTFLQMLGAETSAPTSQKDNSMFTNPNTIVAGVGNKDGPGDQKGPDGVCELTNGEGAIKKPLFLGMSITHPAFRDTRSPSSSAGYNAILHRIAALENIGVRVKIRGNPQLLEDTTQQSSDIGFGAAPPVLAPNSTRPIMPQGHNVPGYVKINVFMPHEWQYESSETNDHVSFAAQDYATSFWYKGWFMLLQIDHEFNEGEFTQTLEVYSLPTDAGQSQIGKCDNEDATTAKPVVSETTPSPTTPATSATATTSAPTASTSSTTPAAVPTQRQRTLSRRPKAKPSTTPAPTEEETVEQRMTRLNGPGTEAGTTSSSDESFTRVPDGLTKDEIYQRMKDGKIKWSIGSKTIRIMDLKGWTYSGGVSP
jgi:hypothetical protein